MDHTCERKTFRKYKEVKHGQTMLLTSHNALKARNHFFTKEICVFYQIAFHGHATLNWRTSDMPLQHHPTMMCQVKALFEQNTKVKAENVRQLILTFKRIL